MNTKYHRFGVWSGVAFIVLFVSYRLGKRTIDVLL